ncbi:MAG: hypothetical protein J5615_01875 [Fibrobacter sp.]|nr:hypothetical protein [Fibrobacter sp.]
MIGLVRNIVLCLIATFTVNAFADMCEFCTYEVTAENIENYVTEDKLKDTTAVFEILDKYINWQAGTREDLIALMSQEVRDYPEFARTINNFIAIDPAVTEKKKATLWADSMIDKVWIDKKAMDKLKEKLVLEFQGERFSPVILDFLNNLQGIRFNDSLLAHRYALSMLAAFLRICVDTTSTYAIYDTVLWNDKQLEELMTFSGNPKKEATVTRLLHYMEKYRGRHCSDERWYRVFSKLDALYSEIFAKAVNKTTNIAADFDETKPILWKGKGCGCSHQDQLNGEVIGIYPYWFSSDTTKWINFSAVTRIAFYGMYADAEGQLHMPTGIPALAYLSKPGNSDFVATAHEHFVKMDWIIGKSDWAGYKTPEQLEAFFANLSDEIDQLVSVRNNSIFQRIVNRLSFSGDDYGNRGDGATLFFRNYPTDSVSTAIFNNFFKNLHLRLREHNPNVFLNMMVNRVDLAEDIYAFANDSSNVDLPGGIYSYANFRKIITEPVTQNGARPETDEIIDSLTNLMLVVTEEPVGRSKRLIHDNLSMYLKGDERHIVLKAIIPVIWFDDRQWEQLGDDAAFFNDSYYGLAVAPFVTNEGAAEICGPSGGIGMCLTKFYKKDDKDITFSSQARSALPFFCMYRWAFRLMNTLVYSFVLLLLLGYFASCTISAFFNKHLALFVGIVVVPPAFTTTMLVLFDPVATSLAGAFRFLPIIILVLSVIAVSLLRVYRNADLPKRNIK